MTPNATCCNRRSAEPNAPSELPSMAKDEQDGGPSV